MGTACPRARKELGKALALDPDLLSARRIEAGLKAMCDFDWEGAASEYSALLAEAPGDAALHDDYSAILTSLGRHEEALEHSRRPFELDPLNEWVGGHRVSALRFAGRYTEAIDVARQVLTFSSDSLYVEWELGSVQLMAGD